ncbi:MAG: response regulator, partial [Myxococcales bacterium]
MSVPSQPQPLSILLVDDDQLDRESVRRALRKVKAEASISEADSISEAEQQLATSRRDCIILDYRLPEGPCIEFLPRLRQLAPHAAFIVLTGQGDETVAVELMKAGAADYLSKDGLDPGRLWRAISYAVTLRRAEEETARVEQQRKRHAAQLRRFAERAPT